MLNLILIGIFWGIIMTFLVFGFMASPVIISEKINKYISKIGNKSVSKRLKVILKVVRNAICILFFIILVLTVYKLFCGILLNIIQ